MLNRCYGIKYQERQPTYNGCVVCDEWLTFSNFKAWMEKQGWKGKQLDKDLLKPGNKVYSPDTCIFVTKEVNVMLNDVSAIRGNYPKGVTKKDNGRYCAETNKHGKHYHIGYFNSIIEAETAYKVEKSNHIFSVAMDQKDNRLYGALLRESYNLLGGNYA